MAILHDRFVYIRAYFFVNVVEFHSFLLIRYFTYNASAAVGQRASDVVKQVGRRSYIGLYIYIPKIQLTVD